MSFYNKFFLPLSLLIFSAGISGCVDDNINPEEGEHYYPDEITKGFSITFRMSLDPMGGAEFSSRASSDIRDMEDYVDLEKIRVLFFTCQDEDADEYYELDKRYESGEHDYFLFESSSRWVSEMASTSINASKVWQVTTPVFPYGNQDTEYDWERIREALTTKKFKIVVLANRPPSQPFPDYDNVLGSSTKFKFDNQGPYWTYKDSWANNPDDLEDVPTINELHHCQWDPVYASKNNILGISSNSANKDDYSNSNGNNVYDIIMLNPQQTHEEIPGVNYMGTVSQWTVKGATKKVRTNFTITDEKDATKPYTESDNYFVLPDKSNEEIGGIPMYGVQKFEPLTNWAPGTPFNISENQLGQDNSYHGKNISLLRSVVRLDLLIPKSVGYGSNRKQISISDVCLRYPNVMARVLPLDAATPTDQIWSSDYCNPAIHECEWFTIQGHNPLIYGPSMGSASKGDPRGNTTMEADMERCRKNLWQSMAWYYGAWKKWWNFNEEETGVTKADLFKENFEPYPHLFNPCVQRNSLAWLDNCLVPDDAYYHYVIYTGEKNINDPSNFRDLSQGQTKVCFFQFTVALDGKDEKIYQIAVTDYQSNPLMTDNDNYLKPLPVNVKTAVPYDLENGSDSYRNKMVVLKSDQKSVYTEKLNWTLLRNHIYRFQVNSFGNLKDEDGIDGLVISTEQREAPTIKYE